MKRVMNDAGEVGSSLIDMMIQNILYGKIARGRLSVCTIENPNPSFLDWAFRTATW